MSAPEAVKELDRDRLVWMYHQMLRIREFEERVKRTFTEHPGVIGAAAHDAVQAVPVGVVVGRVQYARIDSSADAGPGYEAERVRGSRQRLAWGEAAALSFVLLGVTLRAFAACARIFQLHRLLALEVDR